MTPATIPDRTLNQRRDALARANAIRSYRAQLKREIRAGRQLVGPLLVDPPADLLSMQVVELLMVVPKVGRHRVAVILRDMRPMSPTKTVGGLSERQRVELCKALAGR